MNHFSIVPMALLSGAAMGALILGAVGRATMAGVALITHHDPNLSFRGLLEVLLLGTLIGAVGGLLLLPIRRMLRSRGLVTGIILGIVLFLGSWFVLLFSDRMDFRFYPIMPLTLSVVAVVFLIYGIAVGALLYRLEGVADAKQG